MGWIYGAVLILLILLIIFVVVWRDEKPHSRTSTPKQTQRFYGGKRPTTLNRNSRLNAIDHFQRATELITSPNPTLPPRELYLQTRQEYLAALDLVNDHDRLPVNDQNPIQVLADPIEPPQRQPPQRQPHQRLLQPMRHPQPPPVFMIDAAFGFALGGLNELLHNEQEIGEALAAEFILGAFGPNAFGPNDFGQGLGNNFLIIDMPLAAATARGRDAVIADRQALASRATSNAEAATAYVEAATTHTNDPQNSHDTGVLAGLRSLVDRLRVDQGSDKLISLDDVIADIRTNGDGFSEGRPDMVNDAIAVAERTRRGERVVSIGATDQECLQRVWQRAEDPRNAAARNQIRQAVFDALVDAWEPGAVRHIVCVNGRTSRILSALVLLDWDQRNWNVKTLEQFKNEVFERSNQIIATVAKDAAAGSDPGLRAAAAAWVAKTPQELEAAEASEEDTERLSELMRAEIRREIDQMAQDQDIKNSLAPQIIDAVKLEAQAAVM